MNLLLQDPFSVLKEYPETLSNVIESPIYTVIQKFSPNGEYLAIGCVEGTIIIYDMDTLKPIRVLGAEHRKNKSKDLEDSVKSKYLASHTQSIQSIQWSQDGRFLLSASRDCNVKLWDLSSGVTNDEDSEIVSSKNFKFDTFVWNANFLPGDKKCVVCVSNNQLPFIIDFLTEEIKPIFNIEQLQEDDLQVFQDIKKYGNSISSFVYEGDLETQESKLLNINGKEAGVPVNKTGNHLIPNKNERTVEKILKKNLILSGTSKGWVSIFEILPENKIEFLQNVRVAASSIKNIIVSEAGNLLCINAADRTIRQYNLSLEEGSHEEDKSNGQSSDLEEAKNASESKLTKLELHFQHKYQDVINRLQWNSIYLSPNYGEYLVASTHGSSAHDVYLWETNNGFLVRVLEDAGEELLNIDWNYHNMNIISNGLETGNIYNWTITVPPKWSALAPDFEEVDENVKYMEREDEFDEFDEELKRSGRNKLEEIDIDLMTCEKFDVRGNNINPNIFTIPIEYNDIVQLRDSRRST